MAINLETSFSTVVHSSPPPPHDLQAAFVTVVHTEAGAAPGGGGEFPSGGSFVRRRDLVGRFAIPFAPKVEE